MSVAFDEFKRLVARTGLLDAAAAYFNEHRAEIAESLKSSKARKTGPFAGMTMRKFASELVDSVDGAELVMLWAAFEAYCRKVHGRPDRGGTSVVAHCPDFKLRCHTNHNEVHILPLVNSLRDRLVHSLPSYDTKWGFTCDLVPLEILSQSVYVFHSDIERHVILAEGLSRNEIKQRFDQILRFTNGPSSMNFCQLLTSEVVSCLEAYDRMKALKPTVAAKKSNRLRKPIIYH